MSALRALVVAVLIGSLPPALAAQEAPQGVASRILIEEAVLADPTLAVPEEGRIAILLPDGAPETALALDGFALDPRAGIFATRLVLPDGSRHGLRGQRL